MANLDSDSDIAALKLQTENLEKELIEKGVDVEKRLSLLAPHRNLLTEYVKLKAAAEGAAAGLGPGSTAAADAMSLCSPTVFECISRLMCFGECIGTAVRITFTEDNQGNIILTARHCIEEAGTCLSGLSAFGSELQFVAAQADVDVAVFRGPSGRGFPLQQRALQQGELLGLLSFPLAYDLEFGAAASQLAGAAAGAATPLVDRGILAKVNVTGQLAIASMSTGMPNSSSGAVLSDSNTLAGLYTGILWHLQVPDNASSHSGSDNSSSMACASSGSRSTSDSEVPSNIEWNPKAMWHPPATTAVDAVAAAAGDVGKAAELSRLNIEHKNSSYVFTTAPALWQLLQAARVAPRDPMKVAKGRLRARGGRRGGRWQLLS